MFHCEIQNDHGAIGLEEAGYVEIPVVRKVCEEMVEENYKQVKREIFELLKQECGKLEVKQGVREGGEEAEVEAEQGAGGRAGCFVLESINEVP